MSSVDHDWKRYPELRQDQLEEFGLLSPHEQITRDFFARVVGVHDGDTVRLGCDFRDFSFPLRFLSIDTPELSTGVPGLEARDALRELVLDRDVEVKIDRFNRVEKWGRLLGDVFVGGLNVGETMLHLGFAKPFSRRREGEIVDLNKYFGVGQWF